MNLLLFNDGAPLAGGAGVSGPNSQHNATQLHPPSRHNAPAGTSHVAADRIAGKSPGLRGRVLDFIVARGSYGATDDEGEAALGIKPQSYTPRRGELVKLGRVMDSGRRRMTESGCPAAVWVATPSGAAQFLLSASSAVGGAV